MTPDELRARPLPPSGLPAEVVALWHDAVGDWDAAHRIVQDIDGPRAARVHAYLHRKEGDAGNAAYWYRRAGRPVETGPLADEWSRLAGELLPPPTEHHDRNA